MIFHQQNKFAFCKSMFFLNLFHWPSDMRFYDLPQLRHLDHRQYKYASI
ncbi:hypothetical protein L293_0282 [Acinetobacter gyllenbergii CIP 110306 = MTCC 11365]|nr:hypothetical protein L293_0282 [Acinetobacter gyllenbergii CIP 110306 = MTCC 11365]